MNPRVAGVRRQLSGIDRHEAEVVAKRGIVEIVAGEE
jgi:hypothetical protein